MSEPLVIVGNGMAAVSCAKSSPGVTFTPKGPLKSSF
jgi:hypothetical protein